MFTSLSRALVACTALALGAASLAQTPPTPAYSTAKIADNVYVFRAGGYLSMFVVSPEGVIVTDPIGYSDAKAPAAYLEEIRKITQAPVKYVIYSHHHYDHSTGAKVFKDQGAIVVAHRNAHQRLAALQNREVVLPDMIVEDTGSSILLGGMRVDLLWVGANHSDNTLVMLLPKERILYAVDWLPIQGVMYRDMPDGWIPDWFAGIDRVLAMEWDRMIPGHPGPGNRLGTKDDVRALRNYLVDVSNAAKQLAADRKCLNDEAMRGVKLPKYEGWSGYGAYLFGNLERFCEYWARGV